MTIAPLATLLVALIAGLFSVVGLVIAKEQKVSDLRQAWIDALRQDATQVASQFERWAPNAGTKQEEVLLAYRSSVTAVRLRLNKSEAPAQAVLAALQAMDQLILVGNGDQTLVNEKIEAFVSAMQTVLKTEWDRVKDGEPGYRKMRKAAAWGTAIAGFAIVLLGYTAFVIWAAQTPRPLLGVRAMPMLFITQPPSPPPTTTSAPAPTASGSR